MFRILLKESDWLGVVVELRVEYYNILAEGPGIARGKIISIFEKFKFLNFFPMLPPGYPWVPSKNVNPFGPAV